MPVVRCANSPSTNHRLCTPRESGPEVSKNERLSSSRLFAVETFLMSETSSAETTLRGFMREVEDAPPVRQLLERESFAAVAQAIQVVVSDQHHVARFGRALRHQRGTDQHETHDQERDVKGCAHGRVF